MSAADADEASRAPPPSLTKNSLARFGSDAVRFVLALAVGVITARWLGPAGKGALSVLLFLSQVVLVHICTLGLGEASIVLVGQRRTSVQEAIESALGPVLLASAGGSLVLWLVSYPADWGAIRGAVLLAGLVLTVLVVTNLFSAVLESQERLVLTGAAVVVAAAGTTALTVVLVIIFDLGILGAILAVLGGQAAGLILLAGRLHRDGVAFRLRWRPDFLRRALRLGVGLQGAFLLVVLAERLDQVIVYAVAGESPGGIYAVALTMGQMVGYVTIALSASSFPRIAALPATAGHRLALRVHRLGLLGTIGFGVLLAVVIPLATVPLFGPAYEGAVVPAMILIIGGVLRGQQWIIARAVGARGNVRVLVASFALGVVVMVGLDYALVPTFGLVGAAWASVAGGAAGLALVLGWYRRLAPEPVDRRDLVPSRRDIEELLAIGGRVLARVRQVARGDVVP